MTHPGDKEGSFYGMVPNDAAPLLSSGVHKLLTVLAGLRRRMSTEVIASNEQLAKAYGCTEGNIRYLLPKLERAGWVRRERRGRERVFLLLFDLRGDKQPAEAARKQVSSDKSLAPRALGSLAPKALGSLAPERKERARSHQRKLFADNADASPLDRSQREDREIQKNPRVPACEGPEQISPSRPRPEPAPGAVPRTQPPGSAANLIGDLIGRLKPEPDPAPPTVDQVEASSPAAPAPPPKATPNCGQMRQGGGSVDSPKTAPTPAQRHFLDGLTPEQRDAWDRVSEKRRAEIMGWFAERVDPIMMGDALRTLSSVGPPPAPTDELSLPELVRFLGQNRNRTDLAMQAASGIVITLKDRDEAWGYVNMLCQQVTCGQREAESLAEPLEKTLAALANGQKIDTPARYWTKAVANWKPEQARYGTHDRELRSRIGHEPKCLSRAEMTDSRPIYNPGFSSSAARIR